jgi:hypothetical protein
LETDAPVEALLVRARLYEALGDTATATAQLRSALERLHADPWARGPAIGRGLQQALRLAKVEGPQAAASLLVALLMPFAEGVEDEPRRATALRLAHAAGFAEHCELALATVEPHPPWHRAVLADRARCYAPRADWFARSAEADLARFDALAVP